MNVTKFFNVRHCNDKDFDGFKIKSWHIMKKWGTEKSYLCIEKAD